MTRDEIADELLTMLSAGHETTATTLAWAVERIRRHPTLIERLVAERDAGGSALLEATILEVQRARPVIDVTFRTVVAQRRSSVTGRAPRPVGDGGDRPHPLRRGRWPDPQRFDPDRFVGGRPISRSGSRSGEVRVAASAPRSRRWNCWSCCRPCSTMSSSSRRPTGGAVASPRRRLRPRAGRARSGEQATQRLTQTVEEARRGRRW